MKDLSDRAKASYSVESLRHIDIKWKLWAFSLLNLILDDIMTTSKPQIVKLSKKKQHLRINK